MIFKDISCGKKLNKFHSVYKIVHFFATPILIFSACFFGLGMLFASQPGYKIRQNQKRAIVLYQFPQIFAVN